MILVGCVCGRALTCHGFAVFDDDTKVHVSLCVFADITDKYHSTGVSSMTHQCPGLGLDATEESENLDQTVQRLESVEKMNCLLLEDGQGRLATDLTESLRCCGRHSSPWAVTERMVLQDSSESFADMMSGREERDMQQMLSACFH